MYEPYPISPTTQPNDCDREWLFLKGDILVQNKIHFPWYETLTTVMLPVPQAPKLGQHTIYYCKTFTLTLNIMVIMLFLQQTIYKDLINNKQYYLYQ